MARSSGGGSKQVAAAVSAGPAWSGFADAVLERAAVAKRAGEVGPAGESTGAGDVAALDRAVEEAAERFHAALAEPTPFSALVHNAALAVEDAEALAVAAAVEADPGRQRVVTYLHDDSSRPRVSLHLLSVLFPTGGGVRALGPDGALRRAALVDLVEDGPWAGHTVVVRPTVMWALAGDASADDQLPLGTELRGWDGPNDGTAFVAVTGEDPVRRAEEAMRRSSGRRFLVAPAPASDDEWAALVREATIVGAGVVVELDDQLPPVGRRWIERAAHLAWAVTSRLELPIEQMPNRPWRDHHAAATEPTDEEWTAALGDIPRTHRLSPAQLRQVERAHAAADGDLDRAVRRLAGGQIDKLARRIRPTRTWDDIIVSPDRMQLLRELVARYRHADEVYDSWGFSAAPSRGQVALFSGPSGTGKTLAAEIIAGELGLDLFKRGIL